MSGPKVTTDADLLALAGPWLQTCGYCDAGYLGAACTCPDGDPGRLRYGYHWCPEPGATS